MDPNVLEKLNRRRSPTDEVQVVTIVAESAKDALSQIRSRLGPDAIILNVRPLHGPGLARFWKRPLIEVVACAHASPAAEPDPLSDLRQEIAALREQLPARSSPGHPDEPSAHGPSPGSCQGGEGWQAERILERMGLWPIYAQRVMDALWKTHGAQPPPAVGDELALLRFALAQFWRKPAARAASRVHVFIGAPGVGKTTCLCKWMTQAVLLEQRTAGVLRLDGSGANTAAFLDVHCEILGVPVERQWRRDEEMLADAQLMLVDLPGTAWREPTAVRALAMQVADWPAAQVHLVLNAAYDTDVLFEQIRAFAPVPVADLIFTHLDEQPRASKLWNFILGTNHLIAFLSAGQNIPGEFEPASPEKLLGRAFPRRACP